MVSPYSLRLLLSVLHQASVGTTKSQLKQKSYFSDDYQNIAQFTSEMNHVFASPSVKLANKVFVKDGVVINRNFKSIISNFKSEVQSVDFRKRNDVANTINQWVETKTNNLIKNLVDPSSIDYNTALYLVNALYFKAKWESPFNKDLVFNGNFTDIDNTDHKIPFMTQDSFYRQAQINSLSALVLEIPYETGSNFVFWILLPNTDSSLSNLAKNINANVITQINSQLVEVNTVFNLPIFEISTEIDLKSALSSLGMTSLFDNAELEILENSLPLKVSDGKQKNKIRVDTEGTEAASSSCKNNINTFLIKLKIEEFNCFIFISRFCHFLSDDGRLCQYKSPIYVHDFNS